MDGNGLYMSIMTVMAGLTWLLMLAGAGSLQRSCDDTSRLVAGPSTACHIVYRYQWWLIAFYLAVHVGERHPFRACPALRSCAGRLLHQPTMYFRLLGFPPQALSLLLSWPAWTRTGSPSAHYWAS